MFVVSVNQLLYSNATFFFLVYRLLRTLPKPSLCKAEVSPFSIIMCGCALKVTLICLLSTLTKSSFQSYNIIIASISGPESNYHWFNHTPYKMAEHPLPALPVGGWLCAPNRELWRIGAALAGWRLEGALRVFPGLAEVTGRRTATPWLGRVLPVATYWAL